MAVVKSFLLDTSAYSAFTRGDERVRPWFEPTHTIHVPLIVLGELRAGFVYGSKTKENEELLIQFLDTSYVQILPLSLQTTGHFAHLFAQVKKSGMAIGTNDLWIAALAYENDLPILTLDKDFQRIRGIKTIPV